MKKQESRQKDFNSSFHEVRDDQKGCLNQEKILLSDHSNYYRQAMQKINTPSKRQLITNNLGKKIKLLEGVIDYKSRIRIQKENNSYFVSFAFGELLIEIAILKTCANLNFIYTQQIDEGAYGKIYLLEFETKKYVVKSQKLINTEIIFMQENLRKLLEEYFFAKLASCLKIGPKVVPLFGYDILIHENSFEFVMEYCEGGIIDKERMKQDLMENLKIMHSLGIVHLDIKPENISWSNKFKKWIFLDFGFARYLDTKIGYKTETNFIGTFNYASKAMKQLYYLQKKGFVDLYYNDLFSLEKSLKNIQNHQTAKTKNYPSFNIKEKSKTTIFLNSVLAFVKIKFDFSRKNYRQIPGYLPKIDQFRQCLPGIFLNQINETPDPYKQVIRSIYLQEKKKNQQLSLLKNHEVHYSNQIKRIFEEEEQPLLKEWGSCAQFFKQQDSIRKLLKLSWGKEKFMQKMFNFFFQTLFHENEFLNEKNKLLRNLISEYFFPESKSKSDFQKLKIILNYFEVFFLEEQNMEIISKISQIYLILGELSRCSSVSVSEKQKLISNKVLEFRDLVCEFFENIIHKANKQKCAECFKKIKQISLEKKQEFLSKKQTSIIIQIMNKIFQASQKQNISSAEYSQIKSLMSEYGSFSFQENFFYSLIFNYIQQWSWFYQIIDLENKNDFNERNSQRFVLLQVIQQVSNQMKAGNLNKMIQIIENNTFILQIPSIYNIKYYQIKNESGKMKQMIKDFLELIKCEIQIHSQNFQFIVLNYSEQQFQGACLILEFFLQFSLPKLEVSRLDLYESFLTIFFDISEKCEVTEKQKQVINEKLSFILKELINYLQKQKLEFETFISLQQFKIQMKRIKGQKFLGQFISLFEGTIEKREGWAISKQKLLLENLCHFFSTSKGKEKLVLGRLLLKHHNSLSQGQKKWIYLYSNVSFLQTLVQAYGKDFYSLKQIYEIIKNHTNVKNMGFEKVFYKFIECNEEQVVARLVQQICLNQELANVRDNLYLSGFFYLIYRKVKAKLQIRQHKRLLVFSISNIATFPFLKTRSYVLRSLVLNYKVFKEISEKRKKMIHSRRVAYAKGAVEKWKDKTEKNIDFYKMKKIIWEKYLHKFHMCEENLNFKRKY